MAARGYAAAAREMGFWIPVLVGATLAVLCVAVPAAIPSSPNREYVWRVRAGH